MTILVTGTLAIDHIAEVEAGFGTDDLNGKLHRPYPCWGGCGMNLAYGLARADYPALPWVFYGSNCPADYEQHMDTQQFNRAALTRQPDADCAQAFIFTRPDGSQLTGFYPGSTQFSAPSAATQSLIKGCPRWIAGPEDDHTLLSRLPFIPEETELFWMPGQYVDVTGNNVLEPMLARRPHLVLNETEWLKLTTNVGEDRLAARVRDVFVTRGEHGVRYRCEGASAWIELPTDPVTIIDPTGCGDSFCSTLVAGLSNRLSYEDAIGAAQRHAARCLNARGAQSY